MTEFRELLAHEANRHAVAPPPFALVLNRARRRRNRLLVGIVLGSSALCAAVIIPVVRVTNGHRTTTNAPIVHTLTSMPDLGVCADVKVRVAYPGGSGTFGSGTLVQIKLAVGQTVVLTASGTCGVEYFPDDVHLSLTPGQPPAPTFAGGLGGPAPSNTASSVTQPAGVATLQADPQTALAPHPVSFTAIAAGVSELPVGVDDNVQSKGLDTALTIEVTVTPSRS